MLFKQEMSIRVFNEADADPIARFAAEELVCYLQKMLAVTVAEDGFPFELKMADSEPEEGFCITIADDHVCLTGGDGRGLLYAVYEFLEAEWGCCFGAMNTPEADVGEIVPQYTEKEITCKIRHYSAGLPYRAAIVQFDCWAGNADRGLTLPFIDWLAKNRYNRIVTWHSCYAQLRELGYLPELEKRGIRLTVGHHQACSVWLPPEKYAVEHPEFYRLLSDGNRYTPTLGDYHGQWILCAHSEKCVDEVARNILTWAEENPLVDTVAFWPQDDVDEDCRCEQCRRHSKTENYLYFENELAKRLAAVRPDLMVDVLIYKDLWTCPADVELCDNIRIDMSTWGADGLRTCGRPDGSCLIGTRFEETLLGYRQKCRHTVYYEYYMGNYGNRQRVMPAADELQAIFRRCADVEIDGSGTQIECFNLWNNLLNFYSFARSAYDLEMTAEKAMQTLSAICGEGAEAVCRVWELCESCLDGQVPIDQTGAFVAEHIDREKVYALFDQALQQTVSARCRNNLRMLRMAFRHSDLATALEKKTILPSQQTELSYLASRLDSYTVNHTGYGISIPYVQPSDADINDVWYSFE